MKLKNLKPNECVKVKNLKHAEYLSKYFDWKPDAKELVGKYIHKNEVGLYFAITNEFKYVHPSKKFMPKKTKTKIIEEVIKDYDTRLSRIEGKLFGDNELPEKWCVKDCVEVSEWASIKHDCENSVSCGISYYHNGDTSKNEEYAFLEYIEKGYKEISFSDFERLVLKNEPIVNSEQLVVGKWYKKASVASEENKTLIYAKELISGIIKGYGFNSNGLWLDSTILKYGVEVVTATKEEVEEALINEAKRRGFKEGITIESLLHKNKYTLNNCHIQVVDEQGDMFALRGGGACLYHNGKWAEIVEEKATFDWDKRGNLVKANDGDGDAVYLITRKSLTEETFAGICLKSDSISEIGDTSNDYERSSFIPFTGSITLSNEPI